MLTVSGVSALTPIGIGVGNYPTKWVSVSATIEGEDRTGSGVGAERKDRQNANEKTKEKHPVYSKLTSLTDSDQEIVGHSPAFQYVLNQVRIIAKADSVTLIQGETGTGKEVIARAIHNQSLRSCGPFVTLNCAAIPGPLLESELFGHERGAFTGAIGQTKGRFQLADQGTLFLDEIGDLPLELQPKLLRVLQEQEFERLGSSQTIRVNVRVVAATNQDLLKMVVTKQFRADLYYRLNVIPISLPPLRERVQDIPQLVEYFVKKIARRLNKTIDLIPDQVMEVLKAHDWPGNIRELQNVVERAVILSPDCVLRPPLMELKEMTKQQSASASRTLADAEREHILEVLKQTDWLIGGQGGAATRLGLPRTTLIYKMRKLGIEMRRSQRSRSFQTKNDVVSLFASTASGSFPAGAFKVGA
jgi:formate hydrogenlyase transcriptional activator